MRLQAGQSHSGFALKMRKFSLSANGLKRRWPSERSIAGPQVTRSANRRDCLPYAASEGKQKEILADSSFYLHALTESIEGFTAGTHVYPAASGEPDGNWGVFDP